VKTFILFISIIILSISGCKKPKPQPQGCGDGNLGIVPFSIELFDSSLTDTSKSSIAGHSVDSLKLFYQYVNGLRLDPLIIIKRTDLPANEKAYIIGTNDAISLSLNGTKTFYLYRSYNITDTIFYDLQTYTDKNGCSYVKLNSFKYNSKDLINSKEGYFIEYLK